ncbi:hypothetical protein H0H92_008342 [Tricholoma furcatifolium]|nr:hypothetical protein H0H92_008342 [Tricholoma furcatifolium]
MATHFAALPFDILQTLSIVLEQKCPNAPSGVSFLRLPHPRTGLPCLFLPSTNAVSKRSKILEVQAVSPPDSRSWFMGEEVISDGKLLIMTPIDATFLVLPMLQAIQPADGSAGIFRQTDDIFEEASNKFESPEQAQNSIIAKDIIGFGSLSCARDALRNLCDVKEISPEIVVYRFSQPRTLEYLRSKVTRLSSPNALEVSKSITRTLAKDGLMEDGKEALLQVGRINAACDLLGQYLSSEIRALLLKSYDELDAYLHTVREAVVDQVETKKEKKTKTKTPVTDDKKRKGVKGSQGVEKLKKANVNGMAKLSSFFKKASESFIMAFIGTGKTYAEKAIQTQQIDRWPTTYSTNSLAQSLDSPEETSVVCNSNAENSLIDCTAYIEAESAHNVKSSLLKSRKPKPPQLAYSHPYRVKDQEKRSVSFPEVNALRNSPDTLGAPVYECSRRVVSLPAAPGPSSDSSLEMTTATNTADNSSSLDGLDTSFNTSYHSCQTGSIHRNPRRFLSSDMPATPSPPSSPESILVVGNDMCLSRSFLRQCNLSSSDRVCDAEDESGWISWASSPPRPIPALHGPSSLPYARCPSGAEGTIIENADPPKVIWGLDPEDTLPVEKPKIVPAENIIQNDSGSQTSFSKPVICAAKYEFSSIPNPLEKVLPMRFQPQTSQSDNIQASPELVPLVSPESGSFVTSDVKTERLQVWDDIPIDIHALDPYAKGYVVPNSALQRASTGFADLHQPARTSELKPTASVFVPKLPHQPLTPRIFIEPRAGSQITPGRRMSAIEIAQRYQAERQQAVSIPAQSPSIPFSLDSMGSPFFQNFTLATQPEQESLVNYHSNLNLTKTLPGKNLAEIRQRQIERAQQDLSNIIRLSNLDSSEIVSNLGLRSNFAASVASSGYVQPSMEHALPFKQIPSSKPFVQKLEGQDGSHRLDIRQTQQPTRIRSAPGPRAHSIPMTRLIQRRLSSVAEEEPPRLCVDLPEDNLVPKPEQQPPVTLAAKNARKERQVSEDKENASSVKNSGNATPKKRWHFRKRPVMGAT